MIMSLRLVPICRSSFVIVALAAMACSTSSTSSTGPAAGAGTLIVTVTGTTGGVTPAVVVSGPNGYHRTLPASTTLTGLGAGNYSVTASPVLAGAPIVSTEFTPTISATPIEVSSASGGSTTVTYASRGGSGSLWTVGGTDVHGNTTNWGIAYSASQLTASSGVAPSVTLSFPFTLGGNIDASGVAFDSSGNMWVANDNSNTVVAYTPAQLNSAGSPAPAITLSGPALTSAYALAFDAAGDLWVANINANTIVEFAALQLETSGTPSPVITIADGPSGAPDGLAFDASGNLWVANNLLNTVSEYTATQIATGGSIAPALTLSGSALNRPQGLAFDTHGNLWVANTAVVHPSGTIVEYAASLLGASGSPAPALTLSPTSGNAPNITAVAFDNSGNLWYTDADNGGVGEFSASSLAGGGSPQPSVVISGTVAGVDLAFSPHTPALPLH